MGGYGWLMVNSYGSLVILGTYTNQDPRIGERWAYPRLSLHHCKLLGPSGLLHIDHVFTHVPLMAGHWLFLEGCVLHVLTGHQDAPSLGCSEVQHLAVEDEICNGSESFDGGLL